MRNSDNLYLVGDQYGEAVLVYDLDALRSGDPLESAKVWSHHVGISHIAGMKHRSETVFGDVILVAAGASRGKAQMISYPDGKVLWSTDAAGNNPHCIEILPSGNIAVASSTGGTVRLFKTSALLWGDPATAQEFEDSPLPYAHGVLYDPNEQVLWALGGNALTSYRLEGDGANERLVPLPERTMPLLGEHVGGHALAADLTDPDKLCVSTDHACLWVDKKTLTCTDPFDGIAGAARTWVKGLCKNRRGFYCLVIPNGGRNTPWATMGYRQWCSDTLTLYRRNGDEVEILPIPSEQKRAFYKVTAFCGTYF